MLHYQALQQVAFPFLYQYNLSPQSVTIHGVIPFPVSGRPQWRCHILTSPWSLWFSVHKYMNIFTYNCMGFFFTFIFMMNGFCITDLSAMRFVLPWSFSKQHKFCLDPCDFWGWCMGVCIPTAESISFYEKCILKKKQT